MKLLKKAFSLILVLAMVSGMLITAYADDESFTLTASATTVSVGETVTITLAGADSVTANAATFILHYDSTAFEFDEETGADFVVFNANEVNDLKEEGLMFVVNDSKAENKTISAGTWGTFTFTAKKAVSNAPFTLEIVEVLRTLEDGVSDEDITDNFTAGSTVVTVEAETIAVTGISLNKSTLSLIAGGETETLTATVEPENATDKTVTWSSSDTSVATVESGTVSPVAEGTATISATAGAFTAECTVTVAAAEYIPVTGITLNSSSYLFKGLNKTLNLTATISPTDATNQIVVWNSDNESVATVVSTGDKIGKVTSVGVGTANITATVDGVSVVCAVTVQIPVSKVTLDQTTKTVRVGSSFKLNATVTPDNATYPELTWTSADDSIATVDATGVVTAVGAGTVKITATADGKKGNCTVTVVAAEQGAYSVAMAQDAIADVGTTVNVPVTVASTDEQSFNAVDISFHFDPAHLTLISNEIDGFTVDDSNSANGTIRVFRYGDNKAIGQIFILQFRVGAAGETMVTCTEAYVDKSENATTENVAAASITDPDTVISARAYYTVTLAKGLSSEDDLTAVEAGSSVSFTVDDYSPYYTYTITALMGKVSIAVTDNGNGSYTIDNINGNIEVTFTKAGVQSQVTIDGEDTTGNPTATYGKDYVFTVIEEEGYTYEITVTIDGQPYTEYTGPDADGNYTIPGTALTGAVVITVTKTPIQDPTVYTVSFEGSGAADVPDKPTSGTKGESLTFTVNEAAGYKYTITYSVDGGTDVALTGADGSYTVPGTVTVNVQSYIIITVAKVQVATVTWVQNGNVGLAGAIGKTTTFTDPDTGGNEQAVYGTKYSFPAETPITFIVEQHEVFSWTITVKDSNGQSTALVTSTPHNTGYSTRCSYTIPAELVKGDITVTISWIANPEAVDYIIEPLVNTNGKTVYFIGFRTKALNGNYTATRRIDEYDGNYMIRVPKYAAIFNERFGVAPNEIYPYGYLVLMDQGTTLTIEDILPKLSYNNAKANQVDTVDITTDVNVSGLSDINDAQLVYDIYNGKYNDFDSVNMLKFLRADVNNDLEINVADAAAVVTAIK